MSHEPGPPRVGSSLSDAPRLAWAAIRRPLGLFSMVAALVVVAMVPSGAKIAVGAPLVLLVFGANLQRAVIDRNRAVLAAGGSASPARGPAEMPRAPSSNVADLAVDSLFRGDGPGYPSSWRQGRLLLGPESARWIPRRAGTAVDLVGVGFAVAQVRPPEGSEKLTVKASRFSVLDGADAIGGRLQLAVPKEASARVVASFPRRSSD
jgi:hypothetical protein